MPDCGVTISSGVSCLPDVIHYDASWQQKTFMSISFERYGVYEGNGEKRIGFFLPPTFAMLPFISAVETLRAANRYSGKHLYSWHFYGETAVQAIANNGMSQPVESSVHDAQDLNRLIICGPHEPHHYDNDSIVRTLKKLAAAGTSMGALDTGTWLLAAAGLIGERKCTIHWENIPGFREAFPTLDVSSELYEIDDTLVTCAGGDAALDMMLTLISDEHSHELASQVAELFIHPGIRRSNDPQRMGVTQRTGVFHPGLVDCLELMEANVEQPLTTAELSQMVGISKRQLERLFRAHMDTTPTHYYQQTRLNAGHQLLEQTSLTVLEVAVEVGFASAGHFSKRFRAHFGYSPRDLRAGVAQRKNVR